jgi:phosphoenolpyruvate carboxylase
LDALKYYNPQSPCVTPSLAQAIDRLFPDYDVDKAHRKITSLIIDAMNEGQTNGLTELVLQAANRRHFLG